MIEKPLRAPNDRPRRIEIVTGWAATLAERATR